jgi:gliding motility-associated-like protein
MKKSFIFLFLFLINTIYSQTRTDNWYFGKNAGIHLSPINKNVTVKNNGNIFALSTSATISNTFGELLFYTNSAVLTDNFHNFINTNTGIGGENQNAHSSIIIPKPQNPNNYYVITTREKPSPNIFDPVKPGLYFSELNGTTKTIITKRTALLELPVKKITAVHHKNGNDIWIVTIGMHVFKNSTIPSRAFFSIKITDKGFEDPVISKIRGEKLPLDGAMKIAPDGSKIAFASLEDGIFVYNFNNSDGTISSSLNIPKINVTKKHEVYGVEFSKNAKYIYISSLIEGESSYIHQYDLTRENIQLKYTQIFKSKNGENYGALQIASDGKIYHSINFGNGLNDFGNYLGIINKPKNAGTNADYKHNAIHLGTGNSSKGLPNFIQSYFNTQINTTKGCVNIPTKFNASAYTTIDAAIWDFGDGTTANEVAPNHIYKSTGTFTVSAIVSYDGQRIKVEKEVEIFPLPEIINGAKLVQCEVSEVSQTSFNLENVTKEITSISSDKNFVFFENMQEAITGNNAILNPTDYKINGNSQELFVRVIDLNGCYAIASFFIETTKPAIEIFKNMYSCNDTSNKGSFNLNQKKQEIIKQLNLNANSSLNFYSSALNAQLKKEELSNVFISKTTTIYARIDSGLDCGSISPIKLIVNQLPNLKGVNDTYKICYLSELHSQIILDGGFENEKFEWRNSNGLLLSNERFFNLKFPGKYSVKVYKTTNNIECINQKKFTVSIYDPPIIEEVKIDTSTLKNKISITIKGNSSYAFSLDNINFFGNSDSYTFNNVTPGIQTVFIKDINNCEPPIKKEITILGFPSSFTPNDDGINDRWNISGSSEKYFKTVLVQIFNRYGNLLFTINNNNRFYGWDGTSKNGVKLPSNDYWYTAILIDINDNVIKKVGHFSLLRK